MSRVVRLFHTVRHLRAVQIVGRFRYQFFTPKPDLRPPPPLRVPRGAFAPPIAHPASLIGPDRVRLLNLERVCATAADWNPPEFDEAPLWTYNLHYFDDLSATGAAERRNWHIEWLRRWVTHNPPGHGWGWDPYPLSKRLVNWVKWAWAGNELPPECIAILAVQARWLCRRLEYHILGNHLLANAKALVYAGLFFDGPEARGWLVLGQRILERELSEQVLADGAHFELSPQYHSIVLEDLLDLINAARAHAIEVPPAWLEVVPRMERWLRAMCHPDGEISFFNDAALGIAATLAELSAYRHRIGLSAEIAPLESLEVMPASGYVRASAGNACLICDCAPIGPRYLPGHAHADTLSFELSLGGRRVLVNTGISEYGAAPERLRQRGTAAHNTVVVDGENSSEVWAGFRVARRAHASLHGVSEGPPVDIEGSHDGYRRLRGANVHRRRWRLSPGQLIVEDRVDGPFTVAEAHFHLHPDIPATRVGDSEVSLGSSMRLSFGGAASISVQPGTWHPRFGHTVPNVHVVARFGGPCLTTTLRWDDAR